MTRPKNSAPKPRIALKNIGWDTGDTTITREEWVRSRDADARKARPIDFHDHRRVRT